MINIDLKKTKQKQKHTDIWKLDPRQNSSEVYISGSQMVLRGGTISHDLPVTAGYKVTIDTQMV